jgi:two-component system response regulator NreC
VSRRIRVIVADDHTIVRSGVRLMLEAEEDIDVVGEASTGRETLNKVGALRPHVVLMDISMPDMDGLEATRTIKDMYPETEVLALTMHRSDEYLFEMLRSGASGYILKGADTEDLIHAVRVVGQGQVFLYPAIAGKLVKDYLNKAYGNDTLEPGLSDREKEVLRYLAQGFSSKEIANKLFVSPSTIHSHRSNLMNKLGLGTRHELVNYALRRGMLREF